MNEGYISRLSGEIKSVLLAHPDIPDHRTEFPWLIGALGAIPASIAFVAENPSLGQIEAAKDPITGGAATAESQWWNSRGDKLFRQALVDARLKSGSISSADDWRVYITNVIKQPDYAEKWKRTSTQELRSTAEIWAPVLEFEFAEVKPEIVVAMGNKAYSLLTHLMKSGLIARRKLVKIYHYSYVALRADSSRRLGPMDPLRVREYKELIRQVAAIVDRS